MKDILAAGIPMLLIAFAILAVIDLGTDAWLAGHSYRLPLPARFKLLLSMLLIGECDASRFVHHDE